jgi:hypothetical protein
MVKQLRYIQPPQFHLKCVLIVWKKRRHLSHDFVTMYSNQSNIIIIIIIIIIIVAIVFSAYEVP